MGTMEGDAGLPTIEMTPHGEAVNNTSTYGKSTLTHFYLGSDWFAAFTCLTAAPGTGPMNAWWPFSATFGLMGVIASDLAGMAQPLVLTAIAGTPAAGSPNSVTAPKAIITPETAQRLVYGPTHRKVPLRMVLYPTLINGSIGHVSTT